MARSARSLNSNKIHRLLICIVLLSSLFGSVSCSEPNLDVTTSCSDCIQCCEGLALAKQTTKTAPSINTGISLDRKLIDILESKIKTLQESLAVSEAAREDLRRQLAQVEHVQAEEQKETIDSITILKSRTEQVESEMELLRTKCEAYRKNSIERMTKYRTRLLETSNLKNELQIELLSTKRRLEAASFSAATTRFNRTLILQDVSNFTANILSSSVTFASRLGSFVRSTIYLIFDSFWHDVTGLVSFTKGLFHNVVVSVLATMSGTMSEKLSAEPDDAALKQDNRSEEFVGPKGAVGGFPGKAPVSSLLMAVVVMALVCLSVWCYRCKYHKRVEITEATPEDDLVKAQELPADEPKLTKETPHVERLQMEALEDKSCPNSASPLLRVEMNMVDDYFVELNDETIRKSSPTSVKERQK